MSLTLEVFLPVGFALTLGQWQAAVDAQNLPLEFTEPVILEEHSGFLPTTVDGIKAGFELYIEKASEEPRGVNVFTGEAVFTGATPGEVVYSFRYGGRPAECASVFYAAATLVQQFNGRALETESMKFLSVSELRETAKLCLDHTAQ